MRIRVTEDHIRNGCSCDIRSCPVALAMADAGIEYPAVTSYEESGIMLSGTIGVMPRFCVPAPMEVIDFVGLYDSKFLVNPFDFWLPVDGEE